MNNSIDSSDIQIITVGPRALRNALQILEQQLCCLITFEEPDYKIGSASHSLFDGGPIIPIEREIAFTYGPGDRSEKGQPDKIIGALIDHAGRRHPIHRFALIKENEGDIFNIFPVKIGTDNRAVKLLTDSEIAFAGTSTAISHYAAAREVCKLMAQTSGISVGLDRPPTKRFLLETVAKKQSNKAARDILNALIKEYNRTGDRVSWNLVRDAQDRAAIAFHFVRYAEALPGSTNVAIEAIRPLAVAAQILQREVGRRITYEDPEYSTSSCEVLRNRSGAPQLPRGGILRFTYDRNWGLDKVLATCIQTFERNVSVGGFNAIADGEWIHIVPIFKRSDSGKMVPQQSVLDFQITTSDKATSFQGALEKFCTRLAGVSGKKITIGSVPNSNKAFSCEFQNTSARTCLSALVAKLGPSFSWQLHFDLSTQIYVLHVNKSDKVNPSA